jgi:hypothetical protein
MKRDAEKCEACGFDPAVWDSSGTPPLPPPAKKRASPVVWVAIGLLIVAVVAMTILKSRTMTEEPPANPDGSQSITNRSR